MSMTPETRSESHDTLPARLLEMWDALDPVDAWRPPLKEAADEIDRLRAEVARLTKIIDDAWGEA